MQKVKRANTGATGGSQSNLNLTLDGKFKGFDVFNYSQSARFGQLRNCQKCGSDYMRFSINGFCQDCIQRVEFIVREHPHIARDVRNQNREVGR